MEPAKDVKKAVAKADAPKRDPKREKSPWIKHILAVKAKSPGKSLKEVMSLAKDSYKKPE
jgi:hypothetical protein